MMRVRSERGIEKEDRVAEDETKRLSEALGKSRRMAPPGKLGKQGRLPLTFPNPPKARLVLVA